MIQWLKSLFAKSDRAAPPTGSGQEAELLIAFEDFLTDRMNAFFPAVRDAFSDMFKTGLPDAAQRLHIEIFLDDPAFSFRVFAFDAANMSSDAPEPVQALNDTIDQLWPIVTNTEMDRYLIWETDPKWGRQVALQQPLDDLNLSKFVFPWFQKIVSETRGDFRRPITASIHDITPAQAL